MAQQQRKSATTAAMKQIDQSGMAVMARSGNAASETTLIATCESAACVQRAASTPAALGRGKSDSILNRNSVALSERASEAERTVD